MIRLWVGDNAAYASCIDARTIDEVPRKYIGRIAMLDAVANGRSSVVLKGVGRLRVVWEGFRCYDFYPPHTTTDGTNEHYNI